MSNSNQRRQKIIALIKNNPDISANNAALFFGVSTRTIERDFNWLKENGLIKREGADFGGKWIIVENEGVRPHD